MATEIERKFLVLREKWEACEKPEGLRCRQTYLSTQPGKTIRVRTMGKKAWLTIKGPQVGISRPEFEYEIPVDEAEEMLELFGEKEIDKIRYFIPMGDKTWEVDVFLKDNEGLIVAEIELADETDDFERPDWVGEEVSGDMRYTNSNLQDIPFSRW